MASNEIQFDCQRRDDYGNALEVIPCIDGIPLTDLIDRFETEAGMQPAGDAYGGLFPQLFRFGPMDDYFQGRSADAMGMTLLLGCECGESGCWPLEARITVTGDLVTWDSFEQPYRTKRDYTAFGPFQFDRNQYVDAVEALSAELRSDNT
ncbi:hypothetical protein A6A06_37480 [Streptomyces sp. CB02923]|uniref:hypothetical protein n=1 Tax=Streptomyces sp. CB02923 TaxID=1718985 RepID=UPI0009403EA4|nr:hypothetical protein [Streptomyces sp. CB02923]OKI06200.1 hypothetical protein A6A06_37480 [Streptomyces sp. CB02923]